MVKRILTSLTLFCIVFAAFWIASFSLSTLDGRIHGPLVRNKNGQSTNWSGYAVYNSGLASDVKGSWTIPALTCGSTSTYSSAWIGIDGYNDSSVEQTGTEQDCIGGVASYYAWYEMYPKPGFIVPLTIKAGDVMTAEVKYQNKGTFVLTLKDVTTGKSYTTSQKLNKSQLDSAEWITEAPWSGGVLPLANFGQENFSASTASVGTLTGAIGSFGTIDRIDMVQSDGVTLKAQTSALGTGGNNFTINWKSN